MMMSIILLLLKFTVYNQINPNLKAYIQYLPTQSTESIPAMEEHNNFLLRFPIYATLLYLHQFINCLHLKQYFITKKPLSPQLIRPIDFTILTILSASLGISHPVYIISLMLLFPQTAYTQSRKAT